MPKIILILLVILTITGYIRVPFTHISLFTIAGRTVTLNDVLIFAVVMWLIDILPSPLREIAIVALLVWILATLGVIVIAGLQQIVLIALIVGLIAYLFKK
ncbi:MAG TPA: hypothetical protein DCX25_00170 [Candidatus Pacebacteria bacterium]|nr:MAG: hypothetical protein UX00_C0003G0020 [Microgenomates group bacterium GW2011_GWB1_45_17]KKU24174.1 MAG: hypothetical protein UX36_C0002G0157 [Microgenomates group bacterium GW2011_GWC1_46_15]KKU24889.1 MAG: hypothetical protein UX35_C0001G0071 [Microgenomates group bacterium GW2011_GWA1_46_15]HAV14736.1 hypothetical protein [Candidatus Paceibacterota bacterium]HCR11442.1 hypothetical protein [Candidatus Paceibacterota bacterium]